MNVSTPRRRYRRWTLDTTQPTVMLFGTSQQLPMAACKANMLFHCCRTQQLTMPPWGCLTQLRDIRDTGTPGHRDRLSGSLHAKKTYISRGREGGEQCVKAVHENCACFPLQYPGTLHELEGTGVPGLSTATLARMANMHQSENIA